MTVGKDLRNISSGNYYENLDEKMKDASDFLFLPEHAFNYSK